MTVDPITLVLAVLTAVDCFLSVWILFAPRTFLNQLHGSTVHLDTGLTRRTGAFWAGFTLVQWIGLVLWPVHPGLLLVCAGVRFTECVADWILLTGSESFTDLGRLGYALSVPYTLGSGFWLLGEAYRYPVDQLNLAFLPGGVPGASSQLGLIVVLVVLVVADTVRGVVAVERPRFWTWWYHGRDQADSGGLLRRAGGVLVGMALVDVLVLVLVFGRPSLVLLVVGMRTVDLAPPLVYAVTGQKMTGRGYASVVLVTLVNLLSLPVLLSYAIA